MELAEDINNIQADIKTLVDFPDPEFTGELNRSIGQGAKFALMLAMLDGNMTERPYLEQDNPYPSMVGSDIVAFSHYRNNPLNTSEQDIVNLTTTNNLLKSQPRDALLWQAMHPEPLSLFNDAKRLADEVVYNCPYHCQLGLKAQKQSRIEQDPTKLYDILESLPDASVS